jgi:hypothetical protein
VARLPEEGAAWQIAAEVLTKVALEQGRYRALLRWISRYERRLAKDTFLWGLTGYALCTTSRHAGCVQWMRDWKTRDGVEAWMLENLSHSLRYLCRDREGAVINECALKLQPDQSRSLHEVWLASDEVLAGEFQRARDRQVRINQEALSPLHRFVLGLVEAALLGASGGATPARPGQARKALSQLLKKFPAFRRDRLTRRLAREYVLLVRRQEGGFRAWLWALGKLLSS